MTGNEYLTVGLSSAEAKKLQERYGKNELASQKKESFIKKTFHIICEPMFLLLLVAAIIYFILGEPRDGAIMLIFVIGIISIDVIQEWKTDKTLSALRDLSAPTVRVIRNGEEQIIASEDLVPGDVMMICEGVKIPADGVIIKCSDLCVDESSLTGEAEGVWKTGTGGAHGDESFSENGFWKKDRCYAGTLVTQGFATIIVEKTGKETEYGKIGTNVAAVKEMPTPLQKQTDNLVKICTVIAAVLFAIVGFFTYLSIPGHAFSDRIIESILSGITLAMAMIPEEFPVILTVFLSMGAWRLAKKQSLVRKLSSVETLGAVSVLCVDKTGTITMNQMQVEEIYSVGCEEKQMAETMGMACETDAYDPMEKAMLSFCEDQGIKKETLFGGELILEYNFTNELKMMGHVWKKDEQITVAVKGSPESVLALCKNSEAELEKAREEITLMSEKGLRVIAIAAMQPEEEKDIPVSLTECSLALYGLAGLTDPPRKNISENIQTCKKAGIRVVMITGDNGITASAIAKKIGLENSEETITGDMLMNMTDDQLREKIKTVSIFSRVIPEHKMRIVKAFRESGEIVAMTGDGVNDAPALKYADIGIAMGKRGSEVSREAADIILMDDNFTTIVDTIKDGRRIYNNIRKAVGYIFTIHIPIALASLLAPLLGITSGALFLLPLHIVLLELVIDPTCSIVLERQPADTEIMKRKPRKAAEKLIDLRLFSKSVLQGLFMFAASFGVYFYTLAGNTFLAAENSITAANAPEARSMGLAVIIMANLFLVFTNSSDHDFAFRSIKRLAKDKIMWAIFVGTVLFLSVILYSPLNSFLKLDPLSPLSLMAAAGIAALSVIWYEAVKLVKKIIKTSKKVQSHAET